MRAFVLIKISTGEIPLALELLRRLECAVDAEMTFGEYDAVVVLDAPTVGQISHCVAHDIQTIPGVAETCTCLAVDTAGNEALKAEGAYRAA